ncbi:MULTISPECIES: penicillin acylase family protein [Streptomyces]|uniref:penicillin acylase family protein n=1 Tax=Streptomyces albidoflavus TaxID=1886 RepID=UPI0013E322B0|nr:penicillin acylase family protein [Streptomyces albidoflavus]
MRARIRRAAGVLGAVCTAGVTMFVFGAGFGPVPALGKTLMPGGGVWPSAEDARLPRNEQIRIPGLDRPVDVSFTADGVASVRASSDEDLFTAQGYLAARFRLVQMDVQRRLGKGRLAELNGPSGIDSDVFELTLGIHRTAEATWAATPRDGKAAKALTAYAAGVNARLAELERNGQWPTVYGLTGVRPERWTPVDSLVVQGVLTQTLSFDTRPLTYALLSKSLGAKRASEWFPVLPANEQHPYAPGPYQDRGLAPLHSPNANAAVVAGHSGVPGTANRNSANPNSAQSAATGEATAEAATAVLRAMGKLPETTRHVYPNSNAWVANGPSSGGGALLAGDPHLKLSLPSYWYQISLKSPGYDVTGASLPGMPAVLIGRNSDISWSITAVQNQSTFFYREKTDPRHPDAYFWKGAWRPVQKVRYTVPVRGGAPVPIEVGLTVHGPLLTKKGETTSVEWMGNRPSQNLAALLDLNAATDWDGFRTALRSWQAPAQNFAYADKKGNIGVIAPGSYPQIASGDARGPLPGTGESDVVGAIPFDAVPRAYNPPSGLLVTANQRPVGPDYPYYIGPASNFDTGYRTNRILAELSRPGLRHTADGFATLQNDVTDELAQRMVPKLLQALEGAKLTPRQEEARRLLSEWKASMDAESPAAAIWFAFYGGYVEEVFKPWWDSAKVPVDLDPAGLDLLRTPVPLMQNLEKWTFTDPGNPAFTAPGGPRRTAPDAMRAAFAGAVAYLEGRLGGKPAEWKWGRIHERVVPSLTGAPSLGDGPYPSGGSPWTVNVAENGLRSDYGPSLRMVVGWSPSGAADARAVYPGGQSDNPASPWYKNLAPDWWKGSLRPLRTADEQGEGDIRWTLRSEG